MSKPLIITPKQWATIHQKIVKDYPRSVWLIREKTKAVLGFTVREHEEWIVRDVGGKDVGYKTKYCVRTIHLDFYNEPKRVMFLLKYSDFMNKTD